MDPTPPLLVVHPFPLDSRFWGPMLEDLRWPARVFAPEFPGFGGEPHRPGWSIASAGERLAELINERSPDGRAVVCGLSMGGYAALALAAHAPERIAGLVLADTRAEADTDEARAGRSAGIELIRSQGTGRFLDELLPKLMSPHTASPIAAAVRRIADEQPAEALIAALSALADRPNRVQVLSSIRAPVRVVVGADDGVTPIEAAQTLVRGLGHAQLHVVPGAGHLSAIEAPHAFAATVRSLLDDLSP
ncbi:MAG: alpha/beta hydrolase [Thermoleophilia bacterium]|nr:alpha/beta hydrolase [Thermoleophilia bacterium]